MQLSARFANCSSNNSPAPQALCNAPFTLVCTMIINILGTNYRFISFDLMPGGNHHTARTTHNTAERQWFVFWLLYMATAFKYRLHLIKQFFGDQCLMIALMYLTAITEMSIIHGFVSINFILSLYGLPPFGFYIVCEQKRGDILKTALIFGAAQNLLRKRRSGFVYSECWFSGWL